MDCMRYIFNTVNNVLSFLPKDQYKWLCEQYISSLQAVSYKSTSSAIM